MDKLTGVIRARLPKDYTPGSKKFRPGHLAEAEAWLDAMLSARAAPETPAAVTVTVGQWTLQWWQRFVQPVRVQNTALTYLSHLRHLAPVYDVLLPDLVASRLQQIVAELSGQVAPKTLREMTGVWRRCFAAAVNDGLTERNPAVGLVVTSAPRTPATPRRHVTAEEVALLRREITGERFEPVFAVMLGCGLRIGEILGLHWSSVDWDTRRLWISDQFTNGHWERLPKGRNPHWVPLPTWVYDTLRRHRARAPLTDVVVFQAPYQPRHRRPDTPPHPWSRQAVAKDLNAIVSRLGLDDLTPHAGRHGLASALMEGGIPPTVIAERLGNTAAVVLRVYSHATAAGRERADEMTEAYLSAEAPNKEEGQRLSAADPL